MANSNGWGDGSVNNNIGWGKGANNTIGWGKSHLSSWSGATDIDGGNLPSNSVAPAITGTAQEGQTLSCSTGTWSGSPTYTYQWKRNGNNIGGATSSTYLVVLADVGQNILCAVTATNFVGSATANSNSVTPTSSVDADAQAFITAASITDPTQQSAINQLVIDLKGYNIWTKFKAIYPFCGSTASQHKWNLKDPRDLDVAFRILWSGGVTHSANGVQFGGVNGYGNTNLTPSSALTLNSNHISVYSRTNVAEGKIDFGVQDDSVVGVDFRRLYLTTRNATNNFVTSITALDANRIVSANTDARGFYLGSRTSNISLKGYKNGTLQQTNTITGGTSQATDFTALGGLTYKDGVSTSVINYSSKQLAFASIGDGLTDTEAANFYTAVQAFQVTLGRSIGTQTVSDADAQAFVTNAGIVDQVEANAVNNLVIGLKADGLWTKMKACYPMVGGSSSTMKFNLKNPLDTDAAFRLVFNGGWTHSSNGATPNGTNAYASTVFNPTTQALSTSSQHLSYYSRTNVSEAAVEIGVIETANNNFLSLYNSGTSGTRSSLASSTRYNQAMSPIDTRGLFVSTRVDASNLSVYRNGSLQATQAIASTGNDNYSIFLGAYGSNTPALYSTKQCAFASIGDGLTSTDATNLNTRVTTFQTALNRNV